MSYINWNAVEASKRGGNRFTKDGRVYYRDGKTNKSPAYRMAFSSSSDIVKKRPSHISFGVGQNRDFFITTKEIPNIAQFKVSQKGKQGTIDVYGKDAMTKAIKTLTGINPSGDVEIDFNLKKIDDHTYKFIDVEIL